MDPQYIVPQSALHLTPPSEIKNSLQVLDSVKTLESDTCLYSSLRIFKLLISRKPSFCVSTDLHVESSMPAAFLMSYILVQGASMV